MTFISLLNPAAYVHHCQVAPASLEDVLLGHNAVQDAAVIGVRDDLAGELPKAFVVLKPNMSATEQELMDYVAGKITATSGLINKCGVSSCFG